MSDVNDYSFRNNIFRNSASETVLRKQCFLNSASSTVLLLLQNRDVRDVREVRDVRTSFCRQNFLLQKQVFSTMSSETVLLKQFF